MLSAPVVAIASLLYLGLLFAIARYGELLLPKLRERFG